MIVNLTSTCQKQLRKMTQRDSSVRRLLRIQFFLERDDDLEKIYFLLIKSSPKEGSV
jgi:hypothetical protein